MLLPLNMRAIFPRSLMQTHPRRIVESRSAVARPQRLESPASSSEKKVDDDQRENQADAAATVVADSGPHVEAATAKEKYQDDENHYEKHAWKFSMRLPCAILSHLMVDRQSLCFLLALLAAASG